MSFQSKYLGMSPYECPELFSILPFIEYEYGIWHPTGGCNALMRAMASIAEELGVRFHLGAPVESVEFEGRRATGVQVAGSLRRHRHVVLNADAPNALRTLVPPHLRRTWSDTRIERSRYSCSTFMLYLGIDGRYDDVPHHTIYLSADYRDNLADIEHRHVLSADPSMYVQNACVTDPTLAPPGTNTLYLLIPVTHRHPKIGRAHV